VYIPRILQGICCRCNVNQPSVDTRLAFAGVAAGVSITVVGRNLNVADDWSIVLCTLKNS